MTSPPLRAATLTGAGGGAWLGVTAATLLLATWLAASQGPITAWTSLHGGLLAGAWLAAAGGYGSWARRLVLPDLAPGSMHRAPLALALGIALLAAGDALLATVGAFAAGRQWPALLVLATGVALALAGPWLRSPREHLMACARDARAWLTQPWAAWLALPTLAALAAAAAVPPGLLWPSEFGGYDALSYHLQVPREWLALGAAAPLPHNVYSALPSFMESATLHLFAAAQWTDVRDVAVAAQMLQALLAVVAAWTIGCVAAACAEASVPSTADGAAPERASQCGDACDGRLGTRTGTAFAAAWCFVLGVPWMVVVGTLAYTEMGVLVCFAGALLVWQCGGAARWSRWRLGVAIGVLLGAAMGCKLTSIGLAIAPAAAWVALAPIRVDARTRRPSAWARVATALVAAGVACAVLLPWLWRNAAATGSPVFPFAPGIFGDGWWTAEQAARFAAAHQASGSAFERLGEFWSQGPAYGFGQPANPREPWSALWGVAWWACAGALVLVAWRGNRRSAAAIGAMLAAQLAFWLAATHLKSRFLVPCTVPMGIAAGIAMGTVIAPWLAASGSASLRSAWLRNAAIPIALGAWCLQPVITLWRDPVTAQAFDAAHAGGYSGVVLGGGPPDVAQRIADPKVGLPLAWALNHVLPIGSRVATEGEAAVFWCARTPTYGTVWDGGVLARAMREHGHDPTAVIQALTNAGYTHLAVNGTMLDVWARAKWLDPTVNPGVMQSVLARLTPVRPFIGMGGGMIFQLPPRAAPQ